jgi:acyl-CoA ligase (AMP-forming) (exosortase A-associated)
MIRSRTPRLLHELPLLRAEIAPDATAVISGGTAVSYENIAQDARSVATGLQRLGVRPNDRVAVYLPKRRETVVSFLGASLGGAPFVPINPVLKPDQVRHILLDCDATMLVTTSGRLDTLVDVLAQCHNLRHAIVVDGTGRRLDQGPTVLQWPELLEQSTAELPRRLESDIAAIFYTSGSTGKPKGVVLSHRNIVTGALSVAEYLENDSHDCILSLLPLSFDAGFSQLTTAFGVGASVVLLDYLLPRDVVRTCQRHTITGITGVPPLWMQLASQPWPSGATQHMRYFANTGGKMPRDLLGKLRAIFPSAKPFLMYGLTEAFRSTYLPPEEVDRRPDSIGKAIPNVDVVVVREDGSPCDADEPGELVHRGPLVSMGYWKDPDLTRERFRPAPGQPPGLPIPEIAVWSGDTVRADADGFLYFVGRKDDMIKTSGYRVSPTEIEEVAFASGVVLEAAALGVEDANLGQAIVVVAKPVSADVAEATPPKGGQSALLSLKHSDPFLVLEATLMNVFKSKLPAYMVPSRIVWSSDLPRNANGKIDRRELRAQFAEWLRHSQCEGPR